MEHCSHSILVMLAAAQDADKADAARSGLVLLGLVALLLLVIVVGVLLLLAFNRNRLDRKKGEPSGDLDAWRTAGERAEALGTPSTDEDEPDMRA